MRKICKAALIWAFLSGYLLVISGCDTSQTNVKLGTASQTLHLGNGTEPQTLDPHIATGVTENNIISALLEGLISEDPQTLAPRPGAAERWDISDDLKTYHFHLRKNNRWSDGSPLTAHDFVYAWRRLLTPELGAEYAYQLYYLENAEAYHKGEITDFSQVGVKALGDHTLKVELNAPTPFFLSLLAHFSTFPVHPPTIEKFHGGKERGTRWTRAGNFVGNGPFVLTEWALNRIIAVKKNPLYWDAETVKLNEIRFYPIDKVTTEERMFRSGALHLTSAVPAEKIETYKQNKPDLISISPYLGTYFYRFNVTKPPLDDVKIRRALSMSVDRQKIIDAVTKGGQAPAFNFTPPNTRGYTPKASIPFDIEQAKELLAQAGYPNGKGLAGVEILYNTSEGHRKIAVTIQQMWKQHLGIDATLVNQDWKVYLSRVNALDYQIARAGWIGDYADPNTFLDMFVSGGGNNRTGWSSAQYDKLITNAANTTNTAQRYDYFQQAEKILMDESPILPIYTYTRLYLKSPDVRGWHNNILDHHPYKYVYLEKPETPVETHTGP